jgi:hypothetical protein
VARLTALRAKTDPLLLIAVWSLLEMATIAWTALGSGEPSYEGSGVGSLGQAVVVTGIFILLVARGSRIAWWLAIFSDTVGVAVGLALVAFEPGVKPAGLALLQAAALWLIWSGSIERHVHTGRRGLLAPPQPR